MLMRIFLVLKICPVFISEPFIFFRFATSFSDLSLEFSKLLLFFIATLNINTNPHHSSKKKQCLVESHLQHDSSRDTSNRKQLLTENIWMLQLNAIKVDVSLHSFENANYFHIYRQNFRNIKVVIYFAYYSSPLDHTDRLTIH